MITSRTALRWIAIAVALLVATAQDVRAQEGPTAAERKRANRLIVQANRDRKRGDRYAKRARTKRRAMASYRKAVLAYMEAYSLIEHPMLVLKLAEVYRARGEKRWALRGYKKYVELAPEGRKVAQAKTAIGELTDEIAADEAEEVEPAEDPSSELEPTAVFGLEEEEPVELEPDEVSGPDEEEEEEEKPDERLDLAKKKEKKKKRKKRPGRYLRYGGIATAGAGVLLLGVGVKYGLDARSASNDLSNNDDGWTADDRALIERGESAEDKFLLYSLLGASAVIGGGVMYYYGDKKEKRKRSPQVVWAPQITPTGASLFVTGSFW